ncbi:hypothetical protein DRN74_01330 [Candidatus Micrarchaeota archaeon]|nr:MAG: hypothetical protein DRN74_01330 [Candidatus Micrarchaeota archaeon]
MIGESMPEELIKETDKALHTGIDRLLAKVYANKSVKIKDIVKELQIPDEKAEEWANILADHELIDIKYSPISGMVLESKPGKAYDPKRGVYDLPKKEE